ncbi:MAG: phage capsid protein, partial [Bifidobacterium mongoliense]|nr:phage capsid protein [Bifidobacterium mongoliense]
IIPVAPSKGTSDVYAYRVGLDGFHGVSVSGGQLVQTWLPDFTTANAVKKGEVELGPIAVALKATKAAAVLRGVKVQ